MRCSRDAGPPHYVAILGYLPTSDELDAAIGELRAAIRAATGAAVTFGYGPRFQHSTGQEHKGGAPGRPLPAARERRRRPTSQIPGAGYSFGTLIAAEAAGDLQTLRSHGLAAERVKLEGEPADGGAGADRGGSAACSDDERTTVEDPHAAKRTNPLVEGSSGCPVHPTALVIFGATGDLAHRKLLPALYNLAHEGALPERFELIGIARRGPGRRRVPRRGARVDRAVLARAGPIPAVLDGSAGGHALHPGLVRRRRGLRASSTARSSSFDENAAGTR